jgi:hypothetical protein
MSTDHTRPAEDIMKVVAVTAAALVITAVSASAQETYKKDIPDSLAKRAKITESVAAETAQKRVPKGKIEAVELEMEKGKLIYSYELKTAGKSGTDEVNVNAMTGKVVGVSHESAAAEKKEAAGENEAEEAVADAETGGRRYPPTARLRSLGLPVYGFVSRHPWKFGLLRSLSGTGNCVSVPY